MKMIKISEDLLKNFEIATDIPPKSSYRHSNTNKELILDFLYKFNTNEIKKFKFNNRDFCIRFKNLFRRYSDKSKFKICIRKEYLYVKRLK